MNSYCEHSARGNVNDKLLAKLDARKAAAAEIVAALKLASKKGSGKEFIEIKALSMRIELCNARDNQWYVEEAINKDTGEVFEAVGQYWNCNSKLCPNCIAKMAQRSRKKLREAISLQTPKKNERYYFATFTIRNPGIPLLETRELVNRAWTLFRKRSLCVELIRGGVKSEEFTLTANGFHYHLHCIFLSRFILFNEARRVWTECVQKAFDEANIPLTIGTADNMLIVKFIQIHDQEGSIHEVCKYVTKSDSWYKMKPDDLHQIALVRRWSRMFELFGSFAKRNQDSERSNDPREAIPPIVHTRNLSDGFPSREFSYWRDYVEAYGLEAYEQKLHDEIVEAYVNRKAQILSRWPEAVIQRIP